MPNRPKSRGPRLSRGRVRLVPVLVGSLCLLHLAVASPSSAKKNYRYEDDPVRLGKKALGGGELEKAETYFEEAIANEHQVYWARFGLGEILYRQGSYPDAEPLYRQAIIEKNKETGTADFPEAHASLGLVLLRLARVAEAKGEFEQALREKGNLWEAHYGLARIALDRGDLKEAEKHLEKGKRNKGFEEREDLYRYGVALLQRTQGDIEAAEKNALAALHINPNDTNYGTLVGEIYTERGAPTLAIIEYEKVLQKPGLLVRAPVHHELGLLYEKEKRYEDALAQYHEAVRKDSTYAAAWKSMAGLYSIARNREKDAAQSFLRYTELRNDDPEGFLGLARSALAAGLKRPALDAAEQAFLLDSTSIEIRLTLARAAFTNNDKARSGQLYESLPESTRYEPVDYVRKGQLKLDAREYEAAQKDLHRAIEIDSTQADAYFALGLLALNRGNPDSAVVRFLETIHYQADHTSAKLNLGVAYLQLKRPQEAISPLRDAVDAAPSYAAARTYLAMALVNSDSLSAAIVEYKKVLEHEGQNAGALRGLGFCYLKRGDYTQAAKVLKDASGADPGNAEAWVMLGQAQALSGDMEAAKRSFEKALEISPEHGGAKQGLETILKQQ